MIKHDTQGTTEAPREQRQATTCKYDYIQSTFLLRANASLHQHRNKSHDVIPAMMYSSITRLSCISDRCRVAGLHKYQQPAAAGEYNVRRIYLYVT